MKFKLTTEKKRENMVLNSIQQLSPNRRNQRLALLDNYRNRKDFRS